MSERSVFSRNLKAMSKLAKEEPAFFDMANRVLKQYHDGHHALLASITLGLIEAYKAGRDGTPIEQDPEMKRYRESDEAKDIAIDFKDAPEETAPAEPRVDDSQSGARVGRTRRVSVPAAPVTHRISRRGKA